MNAIVACESGYVTDIQSKHKYTASNVPRGYSVGDTEQSYGLVQIHLPAHTTVTKEEATNPQYAADFLAENLAKGRAGMWTCAKQLAIR